MQGKQRLKQYACLSLIFIMIGVCWPIQVSSKALYEGPMTITIHYTHKGQTLEGVAFSVYNVARVMDTGQLEVSDLFQTYPIDFRQLEDTTRWARLADTLSTYAIVDNLQPIQKEPTNTEGRLTYEIEERGIYLIIGEKVEVGGEVVTTKPFLVELRQTAHLTIEPKSSGENIPLPEEDDDVPEGPSETPEIDTDEELPTIQGEGETPGEPSTSPNEDEGLLDDEIPGGGVGFPDDSTMALKVEKYWEVDDTTKQEAITIALYNGQECYDTVQLSETNDWQYEWQGLNKHGAWYLIEETVPKGFTVTYENYGSSSIITNTYGEDEPTVPLDDDGIPGGPTEHEDKLPQTGMRMQVVMFLTIVGLLIFTYGWVDYRKDQTS